MKTKRFLQLTHAMCEQAVLEAFDKKWFRRDYLATVEKYGGVSRAELSRAARLNDWNPRLEVVNSIALEMEQRVEDLVEGETDDLVLLGRRWADIQSAARKLTKWALAELGLTIKTEWVRVDFLSATEEHQRRHLTGAAKGCPGLDMAGYVMHRTYTTIRPRIFLRARRQYLRAKEDVVRQGYIPVWRSYKLVSYNGYFDWTKSRAVMETLKQQKLFKAAKLSVRVTAQRRALKERLAA